MIGPSALVFGLIEGQTYGWFAAADGSGGLSPVPLAFALAALALPALVLVERARARAGRPVVLDLSLFALPSFRYGGATAMIVMLGEFGLILVLPLFLQSAIGFTALQTGLIVAALAAGTFLAGGVVPKLRFAPRVIVRLGLALEGGSAPRSASRCSARCWSSGSAQHAAAVAASADATRRVTIVTGLALLAGVGATFLLPDTRLPDTRLPDTRLPDTGGRRREEE
ncbi:hypothetical protein ACU635_20350 [[Actinomadura] parvosata]|uniref:hypothetical protein n=1 Tax=[Actinomadura] parvosata TaxID=1955412 RepID=UPI00406C19E6